MGVSSCDVVVVGAGIAGWVAALAAVERGLKVLLIDKSPGELGGGNSLMTSGSFRAAGKDPRSDPEGLYRGVMAEKAAHPALAKAWADNCARSVDWLRGRGVELAERSAGGFFLEPHSSISLAPVYKRDVGASVLKKLKGSFLTRGGGYAANVAAAGLLVHGRDVVGITARSAGKTYEIKSGATILTTGGFGASREMVVRYIGKHAGECKLRGSSNDTGDGLRMALEIGAKAVNLNYFYGHLLSLKALTDDRFWPYPRLDGLVSEGFLVDCNGERFVDEGRGDVAVANELARRDDVRGSSLIFDQEAWERARGDLQPAYPSTPPANPWLMENDGGLHMRETAGELADALAVNRSRLAKSLASFNHACAGSGNFAPVPRTGKTRALRPPLYGLKVVPGITFTMGGVLINGRTRVLNAAEKPIAGLYAAGDVIGGLMGGYHGGYAGGLAQAVVTGILAGENAGAG